MKFLLDPIMQGGADPQVRGRRPRRPLITADQPDQGSGAHEGVRPTIQVTLK
jgi:hypothetical protein